jgi:hypothetical protein
VVGTCIRIGIAVIAAATIIRVTAPSLILAALLLMRCRHRPFAQPMEPVDPARHISVAITIANTPNIE